MEITSLAENHEIIKETTQSTRWGKIVIPCHILQNFKQPHKNILMELSNFSREKRARFTYERTRKRLMSRLQFYWNIHRHTACVIR